jgi:hypothetical protein
VKKMDERKERLCGSIMDWYKRNPENLEVVRGIVDKSSGGLSLRILEYFVTNYAPKFGIVLPNPRLEGDLIDVYWSYKEALKCFHKSLFDPFCRSSSWKHVPPATSDAKRPSLRQLNFFRWAIRTGVLDYVSSNLEQIVSDMNSSRKGRHRNTAVPNVDAVPVFAGCS